MNPADYARCPGARTDGELLADCEHCARRVCRPVDPDRVLMMAPPEDVIWSACAYKIEVGADDLIEAARYLRDCAEAEPVATVRVHDTGGNAGIAWSGVPTENAGVMRGGTPLYEQTHSCLAGGDRTMTPAELELARGATRAVRESATGRGILGPAALQCATWLERALVEIERLRADAERYRSIVKSGPVAFVQPDHLNVLARSGKHLVRMSAEPDAPCVMPLYTKQVLWALRQQLLTEIRAVIPANMASDHPYRPVNLGWSQCAEIMRQYIDARLQDGERMSEEQIMTKVAEVAHGSR